MAGPIYYFLSFLCALRLLIRCVYKYLYYILSFSLFETISYEKKTSYDRVVICLKLANQLLFIFIQKMKTFPANQNLHRIRVSTGVDAELVEVSRGSPRSLIGHV